MFDFIYQTGWGAFFVLLFFQLPFMVGFLLIVRRGLKGAAAASEQGISRVKTVWMSVVIALFLLINVASIPYIPAISTARTVASDSDIVDASITAQSWYYDISQQEFTAGQAVRFTAHSTDTVHGFAVYDPRGNVAFTMMLIPGVKPSSLVYRFTEPGTYKIRCLEYCGISHHEMSDDIIVKPATG